MLERFSRFTDFAEFSEFNEISARFRKKSNMSAFVTLPARSKFTSKMFCEMTIVKTFLQTKKG